MPWLTENGNDYWMPEVLPEPTEKYQISQSEKIYLTSEGVQRRHPGWTYADNMAYVDDEYLFKNEGWKVVIDDNGPTINENDLKHKIRNDIKDWESIDESSVKVTYTITDFTTEEINTYIEEKLEKIRKHRNFLLGETDWVFARANEENLTVPDEIKTYRQQLRDFPDTIVDIVGFDIDDKSLWPIKPKVYVG